MVRRSSQQWLALIDQHKTGGLTQTEFAKQQYIDLSYLSLRKRQLLSWQQDDKDGFVELMGCCSAYGRHRNRWPDHPEIHKITYVPRDRLKILISVRKKGSY